MIIFFLRHGETEATKAGEIQGGANGERNSVTKEGLEKVRKTSAQLFQGFEDYYVSDYGRVANFNYRNTGDSILLKPFNTKDGYEQISLVNNGKKIKKLVHRLVAEAFIPNPQNNYKYHLGLLFLLIYQFYFFVSF